MEAILNSVFINQWTEHNNAEWYVPRVNKM
jgi:hypothetical protein